MKTGYIENRAIEFYRELILNKNHRFQSWEHCFSFFQNAFISKSISNEQKDHLSLHLAFYLASWGMYRGSSFILQKDYKVFYPIIDLLFSQKDNFNQSKIKSLLERGDSESIRLFSIEHFNLDQNLNTLLKNIKISVKDNISDRVSATLKTKIILGTLGSIPAYDRFFQTGLKEQNLIKSYSKNGIYKMLLFAKSNLNELNMVKRKISSIQNDNSNLNKLDYPYMKIIDMYFWKIGFDKYQR